MKTDLYIQKLLLQDNKNKTKNSNKTIRSKSDEDLLYGILIPMERVAVAITDVAVVFLHCKEIGVATHLTPR